MAEANKFSSLEYNHNGFDLQIRCYNESKLINNFPSDSLIVRIEGELNLYTTPALRDILEKIINEGISKILLDLEKLLYVDSSGLGALLGFQSQLNKKAGFLRLCAVSENVDKVLEMTKLKQIMKISDTLEEAIREL